VIPAVTFLDIPSDTGRAKQVLSRTVAIAAYGRIISSREKVLPETLLSAQDECTLAVIPA
jgi:hypothetical protein